MASALTLNKVGALFVFFITSTIGVWIPFFIPVRQEILKFGLLFASGLFLSVAFLHLIVDCINVFSANYSGAYPLPFLVIVGGFYLTWLADLIAGAIWKKRTYKANVVSEESPGSLKCCKSDLELLAPEEQKCSQENCPCTTPNNCSCSQDRFDGVGPSVGGAVALAGAATDGSSPRLSLLDVVMLLMALCFHAIFEGLAVGLTSTAFDTWSLTASICLNEFFEGLALGTTLRAQSADRPAFNFFLYALGASVVAPLGVVIGIIMDTTTTPDAASWAQGIGNGLAGGVFISIATRHLIAKAMMPEGPKESLWMPFCKYGVSLLGLVTNALTTLKTE